jgi:predicted XRE-type DNA-binding protein
MRLKTIGSDMAKRKDDVVATVSSGNVFADLGLPNAEELGTKVRLAASLNAILAKRKMTQAEAARVLGVNQPKVSALKGYKLEGFSVERLMHFVTALEHDVVIEIRPRVGGRGPRGQVFVRGVEKKGAGRVRVVGAA